MTWQETALVPLLAVSAMLSVGLIAVAWRNRSHTGVREFTLLMVGAALWAAADAAQIAATDLRWMTFWRTIGYVGHNIVPIALLTFAVTYTGLSDNRFRRVVALLAIEPLLVAVVVTPTNPVHHLIYTDLWVEQTAGVTELGRTFGPWYWVNTAYNYVLVTLGLLLFVRMVLDSRQRIRWQGVALVGGAMPAFAANIGWVLGITRIDYTSATFGFLGIIWGFALFRYRLLDLVPVARNTVLDNIRDGYLVLDERDRVVDMNAAARDLLADADAPLGTPIADVLPACEPLVQRHRPGEDRREEVVVERGDDRRYFDARLTPLEGSRIAGRLLLLRDVTDVRTVERRYQTLIEQSSDIISVTDADGRVTYASPSTERVLGYDPESIVGRRLTEFVHPDQRAEIASQFPDWGDDSGTGSVEYQIEAAGGEWIWVESRGRNLLDDHTVDGIVINTREITERKRHEQDLERKNERLDRFASIVSHDLRNPLSVIQGRAELARTTGDESHVDAIVGAADRMERLVDDGLTLARQGRVVGETDAVFLERIARECWGNVSEPAATLSVVGGTAQVAADEGRLRELLENLFRNAIEHGETDRPGADDGVTVTVGALEDGFFVADDGAGIPDDEKGEVFEYGYTTRQEGTGFGLSIVADIADAHGWTVTVTDSEGGGARFEFSGVERATATERDSDAPA